MPSCAELNLQKISYERSRRAGLLAVFVAAGLALSLLETFLPRPVPFFRLGLANLATLWALLRLGPRAAVQVAVLRVITVSLLLGSLFSPAFFFALAGGGIAALGEAALYKISRGQLSILLLSLAGAVLHNAAQWGVLQVWTPLPWPEGSKLLALLYLLALPTGAAVGLIARAALDGGKASEYALD